METDTDSAHPPLFTRHARRPRLTRLLDESRAQALVVSGPAGYGKTTLASEWLQGRDQVVWYRATSASADVAAFSAGLADVVAPLVPGAGERLKQRLRVAESPERAARPLAELLAHDLEEWPPSALLVIDDYHLVADSAPVEDFFDWLLTLQPKLRVLVTTRRRPRWASARRILYGEITEIDGDQLAMTAEEARGVLGADRSTESIRALVTQAEGWPALIGLAALTASSEMPDERVSEALYRYFAEEVVRHEPPDLQHFMLLASVPATIDARVAREVLDIADPEPLLDSLAQQGLAHTAGTSFRLHPLLRSFLRKRLETDDADRHRELTGRAILDARRGGKWEEAFELGIEAGLADLAAEILEDATVQMLASGKVETLERWLMDCGSVSLERTGTLLARVEVLTRKGMLNEAAGTAAHLASRLTRDHPQASRAQYLAGRAHHLMSKETSALQYHLAARASARTEHDESNALWGAYLASSELGLPDAPTYLNELEGLDLPDLSFRLRVATGRMAHAINIGTLSGVSEAFQHLISVSEHASDPMDETSFLTRAAEIEVLQARYASARALATRALELSETLNLEFARPLCLVPLIAADIGLRQFGLARENLFRVSRFAHAKGDPYLEVSTRYLQLKLHASDPRARLPSLLEDDVDASVDAASRAALLALLALEHAVRGNASKASDLAHHAVKTSDGVEAKYYSRAAELIVTRSRGEPLKASQDRAVGFAKEAARDEVLDVLVLTCRTDPGFAQLVAHDAVASRIVGHALVSSGDRRIVEKAGIVTAESRIKPQTVLTPRELEVLDLLGRGFSNADIASELVISLSTAKVHVHRVLKKLGLQTRLQAGLVASEVET